MAHLKRLYLFPLLPKLVEYVVTRYITQTGKISGYGYQYLGT